MSYEKEIKSLKSDLKQNTGDTILLSKIKLNEEKLAKANENYNHIEPYLSDFDNLSAN